jgi:hypothetical protein
MLGATVKPGPRQEFLDNISRFGTVVVDPWAVISTLAFDLDARTRRRHCRFYAHAHSLYAWYFQAQPPGHRQRFDRIMRSVFYVDCTLWAAAA